MRFRNMLTDRATIYSGGQSYGPSGGIVHTPTAKLADVPCAAQPIVGSQVEALAKRSIEADTIFIFDQGIDLTNGDLIEVDSVRHVVTYFEFEGSAKNLCGVVFAAYGKKFIA